MNANWKNAKKDLKALGIKINTSIKGCCLGCQDNSAIDDAEPAMYQLRSRWSGRDGGYLSHQNIADTELAAKVMVVFNKNGIKWEWDASRFRAIEVVLEEAGI
jgi:hypothetical protein